MLFHGGSSIIEAPKIIPTEYAKEFGAGFYCTKQREQAVRWALRTSTPTVSSYQHLQNIQLNTLFFPSMTEEWLDFVVKCRRAEPFSPVHGYDLVLGPMVDGEIYNHLTEFMEGRLPKEVLMLKLKWNCPTHQACFATEKALSSLRFQKSWNLELEGHDENVGT